MEKLPPARRKPIVQILDALVERESQKGFGNKIKDKSFTDMLLFIFIKIIAITIITVFLIAKPDSRRINHFPHQIWTPRELLPVYWIFVFLSLISLLLYKNISSHLVYQVISYLLSLLAMFALFLGIKKVIFRRKLSLQVVGLKFSYFLWFLILVAVQYAILVTFVPDKNIGNFEIIWPFIYFSSVLILWPIIEEVFFLGMLYIPTSRRIGLIKGAFFVSLLNTLMHFNHTIFELPINLVIVLLGCFLYIKTKGILVPLLLHSSLNFLTLLRELKLILL